MMKSKLSMNITINGAPIESFGLGPQAPTTPREPEAVMSMRQTVGRYSHAPDYETPNGRLTIGAERAVVDYINKLTTRIAALEAEVAKYTRAHEDVAGLDVNDVVSRATQRPPSDAPSLLTEREVWAIYLWGWNEEQLAEMGEMALDRATATIARVRAVGTTLLESAPQLLADGVHESVVAVVEAFAKDIFNALERPA